MRCNVLFFFNALFTVCILSALTYETRPVNGTALILVTIEFGHTTGTGISHSYAVMQGLGRPNTVILGLSNQRPHYLHVIIYHHPLEMKYVLCLFGTKQNIVFLHNCRVLL